jgi:zinc D-Ala-D-Ala carboxypeptidase
MLIGKYLTLEECCKSATAIRLGIDNKPNQQQIIALQTLATNVYDKVCEKFLLKIPVTSAFRSKQLNDAISGSSGSSQHMRGEAMDLDLDGTMNGVLNVQIFNYIRFNLDFDQLIWEFGTDSNPDWVHVSYDVAGKNRKNVFKGFRTNGKVHYKPY